MACLSNVVYYFGKNNCWTLISEFYVYTSCMDDIEDEILCCLFTLNTAFCIIFKHLSCLYDLKPIIKEEQLILSTINECFFLIKSPFAFSLGYCRYVGFKIFSQTVTFALPFFKTVATGTDR